MWTFTEFLGMWYVLSSGAAFLLNNLVNFYMQKFWAFGSMDKKRTGKEAGKYTWLAIFTVSSNFLLLYLLVERWKIHYLLAQIPITIILTVISYFVTRKIFKKS